MQAHYDPYEILGVDRGASVDEIKKAYRSKAKRYHPDVNPGDKDAEDRYKDISRAYNDLTNPDKQPRPPETVSFNLNDLMREIFEFNIRQTRDIRISLPMTLRNLVDGMNVTIRGNRREMCDACGGSGTKKSDCPTCGGSGRDEGEDCENCNGSGKTLSGHCSSCSGGGFTTKAFEMNVDIPPGLNVSPMVIPDAGHHHSVGEPRGNLIITHQIKLPPGCSIAHNTKMLINVGVDPAMFIVGGDVSTESPLGDTISVAVPERSIFGAIVSIPGLGLPTKFGHGGPRADLDVRLIPEIPDDVSPERVELLREYIRLGDVGESQPIPE
jgi:molecular chaperone DnaJ